MRSIKIFFLFLSVAMLTTCHKDEMMPLATLPTVITLSVSDMNDSTAICGGEVTDVVNNVLERGVCFDTVPNPTNKIKCIADNTIDGKGIYFCQITNLTPGNIYYVRAYATNPVGTVYGNQITFIKTTDVNVFTTTLNGISFNMIKVYGGTFMMGATDDDSEAYGYEKPRHSVTLSDYWICETEVTQALWRAVMGNNPSCFAGYNSPVENVSWDDCQAFISKLNQLTGSNFRLPTEAEWEYAARGGDKSRGYKYAGSDNINNVAWYGISPYSNGKRTHPVKTKSPNELGLYDMSGNVMELCADWYGEYSGCSQTNPKGPSTGSCHVYRGGSWYDDARCCRMSYRFPWIPNSDFIGLRLAL